MSKQTFEVDKKGMANIFKNRGLHRLMAELFSNSADETGVTKIDVKIEPTETNGTYKITVEDDAPEGFRDLTHAYTMFAPSYKKDNPNQRGRFNFGEKWVIAICKEATIITTKGGVSFDDDGRHSLRTKRDAGTIFTGTIRSNREEVERTIEMLRTIIPNKDINITINGEVLQVRNPVASFETTLPTVRMNENGDLSPTERNTVVDVYEVLPHETARIYELGIPIVSTGDIYHYDIRQKVPLSLTRDNVKPAYLKKIRAQVLNHTAHLIPSDRTGDTCIKEALENASPEALDTILTKQFGEKRAIFDPSDMEANNRLMAEGYTIIPARTFDKATWGRIKETGSASSSGSISPTPKAYGGNSEARHVPEDKITEGMKKVVSYIEMIGERIVFKPITVAFINEINCPWSACYGNGSLDFNVARLGYKWFDAAPTSVNITDLIIHELGHEYSMNHLSEDYYNALSNLGGKIVSLSVNHPELFEQFK